MQRNALFTGILLVLTTIIGVSSLCAQDDYEKWKKGETETYQQWKDARDKEFTEFLNTEWKAFKSFKEQKLFDTPKPKTLPVAPAKRTTKPELKPKTQPEQKIQPEEKPESKPEVKVEKTPGQNVAPKPVVIPETKIPSIPEPQPEAKPEPKTEKKPIVKTEAVQPTTVVVEPSRNTESLSLDFYDASVPLKYDNALKVRFEGPPSGKTVSAFWEGMSKSNYEDFLKQALAERDRMRLNDWGYCEFLNKTAERLYPGSRNESNLFDWFMLTKSGYQAKIGYSGDHLYLLLPTSGVLYGVAYYMFGKSPAKFYNVMFDRYEKPEISRMYSYDKDYPDATKLTNYYLNAAPEISTDIQKKTLTFTHNGSDYSVNVEYDKSAVKFFEYYPQTNLEVYFDAPPSSIARTSLLEALKPFMKDRSETEAVDLLLHFVQTAFKYETDDEQFHREKPFFPEETLYYPGSDCEDRAVLFSFLVRNLLGLEVVGLDYPNHVATAVRFKTDVTGDQVVYQSRKYTICDPTYINADYGMSMPQFKNIKPGIIALK